METEVSLDFRLLTILWLFCLQKFTLSRKHQMFRETILVLKVLQTKNITEIAEQTTLATIVTKEFNSTQW